MTTTIQDRMQLTPDDVVLDAEPSGSADPQDELAELREVVVAAVEMARGLPGAEAALDLLAKALDAVEAAEEDEASGGEAPSRATAVAAAAVRSRKGG